MIEVLYEDNHILVANKPAGLLTQPSGTADDSMELQAKKWLKDKYRKMGNVFLGAVHRLDRAASGIVVFAKSSKALSRLSAVVREKNLVKKYLALVASPPPARSGTLKHFLTHDHYRANVVEEGTPDAKEAILTYRIKDEAPGKILLEIDLLTGRYHQIRCQLAAIGSPIIGDQKYGGPGDWPYPGIALHHTQCEFCHPTTKERLTIKAPCMWFRAGRFH